MVAAPPSGMFPPPGILLDDPLSEAGRKTWVFQFNEMQRHEAGTILGEDIEALHDMRVATRRMRAAFEVFAPGFKEKALQPHLKGLRATGRALGRVRDLDVFLEKASAYRQSLPNHQQQGLQPLFDGWQQQRAEARAGMIAFLQGRKYAHFKRDFAEFLEPPGQGARRRSPLVKNHLQVLIAARMQVVRSYDSILPTATLAQFHALRIEFKKLRYTAEFFREVLDVSVKEMIAALKGIQDHLGNLNDADVACIALQQFYDRWQTEQAALPVADRQSPKAILTYYTHQAAERHRLMITFGVEWNRFWQGDWGQALYGMSGSASSMNQSHLPAGSE